MGHGVLAGPPKASTSSSYSYSVDVATAPEVSVSTSGESSADVVVATPRPPKPPYKTVTITKNMAVAAKPQVTTVITKTVDGITTEEVSDNIAKIAPDGNPAIYITKNTSANDKSNVLFIVDGKPVKDLSKVVSTDIKSVKVLTDKDATKAYGEKGKNGVVVITTKKGK